MRLSRQQRHSRTSSGSFRDHSHLLEHTLASPPSASAVTAPVAAATPSGVPRRNAVVGIRLGDILTQSSLEESTHAGAGDHRPKYTSVILMGGGRRSYRGSSSSVPQQAVEHRRRVTDPSSHHQSPKFDSLAHSLGSTEYRASRTASELATRSITISERHTPLPSARADGGEPGSGADCEPGDCDAPQPSAAGRGCRQPWLLRACRRMLPCLGLGSSKTSPYLPSTAPADVSAALARQRRAVLADDRCGRLSQQPVVVFARKCQRGECSLVLLPPWYGVKTGTPSTGRI